MRAGNPLQLPLGLGLWLVWFGGIYGGLALACDIAPPPAWQGAWTAINGAVLLSTLVLTALLLYWTWCCWRAAQELPAERMVARTAAGLHLTAAVCTLVVGGTALFLPPCV